MPLSRPYVLSVVFWEGPRADGKVGKRAEAMWPAMSLLPVTSLYLQQTHQGFKSLCETGRWLNSVPD